MLAALVNVEELVQTFGYPLLFLAVGAESSGVPIPGETALITAAVLASQGKLQIELVIAVAALGAIVGDTTRIHDSHRFGKVAPLRQQLRTRSPTINSVLRAAPRIGEQKSRSIARGKQKEPDHCRLRSRRVSRMPQSRRWDSKRRRTALTRLAGRARCTLTLGGVLPHEPDRPELDPLARGTLRPSVC